jgi:membrane fusion protein (multidrug efflux system)
MAEIVLKFAPQADEAGAPPKRTLAGMLRARARLILLVIVPALALGIGLEFYLMGGRYISTDNAYIGAQKVLITPDVSGKVNAVLVREGQHVVAGDPLFKIDLVPFELALRQAESKLETVRTSFASLKSNYKSLGKLVEMS